MPAFFVSSLSIADLLSFVGGPDFLFFNKDPYLLSFLGGQILSSPTRILCPLSFLDGQSLSSLIRIPCLLSFLGSQIFVFLIKDSLSFEVLGWPDFVYSLSFEVIGWVGQLHCCASQMTPTQLPHCHRLCALLPVTAQCLQHNSKTFLYCLCVSICLSTIFCVMKLQ